MRSASKPKWLIPDPMEVMDMLDVSLPKLLLKRKKTNPSLWRWLSDVMDGTRASPHIEKLADVSVSKKYPFDFENLEGKSLWESFCLGLQANVDAPYPATFCHEAIRLERMRSQAKTALESGKKVRVNLAELDFFSIPSIEGAAFAHNLHPKPECLFAVFRIVSSLYLLACWELDEVGETNDFIADRLVPLRNEKGQVVRPMQRWMVGMRARYGSIALNELYDRLLVPRSRDENIETLRRVGRKWWQKGEIPAWSRVEHTAQSLAIEGEDMRQAIYTSLAFVRILDHLWSSSVEIHEQWEEWDPLSPFGDYVHLRRVAQHRSLGMGKP